MERKKASDFPQELLNLLDGYVHGGISRRQFLRRAEKFAVGGVTAAALFQMLKPNFAWAIQVPPDDKRIKAEPATVPSPQGNGSIKGYLVRPANADKLPAIVVVHENRGLNPYIEDVARRLAVANFIAFAPDGLTSVGGYPGDEEKALALFGQIDRGKMTEDFLASANWLKSRADSTGKLGAIGFCFGGGVVNQLAVRMGPDLAAGVPFYGAQPKPEEAAKIKAPINAWRARFPHHRRLAGLRCRPHGGEGAARGSCLQGRQSRLPQRHDPALRRSRRQGSLAAHARLVQQIPEDLNAAITCRRSYRHSYSECNNSQGTRDYQSSERCAAEAAHCRRRYNTRHWQQRSLRRSGC